MDPIRTAVKYSLIPLRTVVQIGDAFVGADEQPEAPQSEATPTSRPRKRTQARKAQRPRKAAGPQASQTPKDLDDVAIARKVETVIFRDDSVPKGKIDVNAADGVVWLRGEARNPDMVKELERLATAIPEVKRVENLLHLPKTPAPTRADTPQTQQRTRSTTKRPTPEKVETAVTNERLTAKGEDLPVEAAHEGEGREPAPLGSNGNAS
ncbi:MAG TPA: BON domain-containing protein [Thermoleophilaceae bacterium]|nr:BON domain-containing protein [Thermoleophilaceae bacterium]